MVNGQVTATVQYSPCSWLSCSNTSYKSCFIGWSLSCDIGQMFSMNDFWLSQPLAAWLDEWQYLVVELGDLHLPVLEPGLGCLVLLLQLEDAILELLLPLHSLLRTLLQLLHVLTHRGQLVLHLNTHNIFWFLDKSINQISGLWLKASTRFLDSTQKIIQYTKIENGALLNFLHIHYFTYTYSTYTHYTVESFDTYTDRIKRKILINNC